MRLPLLSRIAVPILLGWHWMPGHTQEFSPAQELLFSREVRPILSASLLPLSRSRLGDA